MSTSSVGAILGDIGNGKESRFQEGRQFPLSVFVALDQLVLFLLLEHHIRCQLCVIQREEGDSNHQVIADEGREREENAVSRVEMVKRSAHAHRVKVNALRRFPVQRHDLLSPTRSGDFGVLHVNGRIERHFQVSDSALPSLRVHSG